MFETEVSLLPYNTFSLSTKAKHFYAFKDIDGLQKALIHRKEMPLLILGGGSNILFTKDFEGLVLKNELKGIKVLKETEQHFFVKVQAGENWHQFVLEAIKNDWAGVENLSLIPGTVGAAPMQNIGAYGVEIEQVFEELEALEIKTGKMHRFSHEDCEFGYRESVFKKALKGQYIICNVTFKLLKEPDFNTSYGAIQETLERNAVSELSIRAISDAVTQIRQTKLPDPKKIGNAGSFFKNPVIDKVDFEGLKAEFNNIPGYQLPEQQVKVPAAWLIDQCGWKGKTFGEIGVHKNQPLVLVNYGHGKGEDIKALALEIKDSVRSKFGIELTPEVNMI